MPEYLPEYLLTVLLRPNGDALFAKLAYELYQRRKNFRVTYTGAVFVRCADDAAFQRLKQELNQLLNTTL